jgi:pyrimidine deaminase RibD-like protein
MTAANIALHPTVAMARKRSSAQQATMAADRKVMLRAIDLARKCVSEPGKISPNVGAVACRDGKVLNMPNSPCLKRS